jgi:segregation and condensation protein A
MAYHILLPQFEGPLELLLALIEKQKLDITRVSLAQVADQYVRYIAEESVISLENLAWFLVIASRLLLIKSKALLPTLLFDDAEEEEMVELEQSLAEYKKFKDAAMVLRGMFDARQMLFAREGSMPSGIFYPPKDIVPEDLAASFEWVLDEIVAEQPLPQKVVEERVSLEERMVALEGMLRRRIETSFADIVATAENKVEVVVSFLAMLELVKQRVIRVEQLDALFSDIQLFYQKREEE